MRLEFDPGLVERSVRLRELGPPASWHGAYRSELDGCYRLPSVEAREHAFTELHARWFVRLGFAQPLEEALALHPAIGAGVERAVVALAPQPRAEGAELYVRGEGYVELRGEEAGVRAAAGPRRRLRIQLLPETAIDRERLEPLLAIELQHVADMLDPGFGYEPHLPAAAGGQTHDRLVLDRYSAAWAASVTGRLRRRGQLAGRAGERAEGEARGRFARAFAALGTRAEEVFQACFDGERPTHAALRRLALFPREALGAGPLGVGSDGAHPTPTGTAGPDVCEDHAGACCPLCALPSYGFARVDDDAVGRRIAADFPAWTAAAPVCPRCLDLYTHA